MNTLPFRSRTLARLVAGVCLASSVALTPAFTSASDAPAGRSPLTMAQVLSALKPDIEGAADTEALERATAALKFAADMKLPQASKAINEALQLDARNSYLHFFNGLIYHLQARQGDTDKTNTAVEGYQQAIRLDANNWLAHEFLGLAYVELRQYAQAQSAFAEVLLTKPDDLDTLLRMMAASYMSGDALTACTMADRISAVHRAQTPGFLRASVSVYASCAEFKKAEAQRESYKRSGATRENINRIDQRVESWRTFHKSRNSAIDSGKAMAAADDAAAMQKTQFSTTQPPGGGFGQPPGGGSGQPPGGGFGQPPGGGFGQPPGGGFGQPPGGGFGQPPGGGFGQPPGGGFGQPPGGGFGQGPGGNQMNAGPARMVLVDVVMVRTEDSVSTSKGVNLMNALTLQFGSIGSPAYSRNFSQTVGSDSTTLLTRAITVPALAYSLNIANANSNLNEVLARPTLAALDGMRSEFFSGSVLNAAVVSSGSGTSGSSVSIEKRYGVKLAVQPRILPDGMIMLAIDASRTFLKPPSSDIGFTYKLEISEILATANVVMRMGDTLILGGLSEKETTNNRDGVPMLQDVPGLQYLFSKQSKNDYQKSVLILITPRPTSYTWLSDESKAAFAKKPDDPFTPSLDVLRARYSDWFKPYPNLASVFHHLNAADLYREFRTGDVTLENWDRTDSTRSRLKQALGFLYY